MDEFVNGLTLSREYFTTKATPSLQRNFGELFPRLAAGLVGNGSQCFGYDDEISCDHDWGIDFYIWTTDADKKYIPDLLDWKSRLLSEYPPETKNNRSVYSKKIDVMTCGDFYTQLIGVPNGPHTLLEWRRVPEENFAIVVNGEIFIDGAGEFTNTRNYLLKYYPEDIRKKKISSCCMILAQTGQYNLMRTAKRNDRVTLRIIISRFIESAISMVFLLNKTFKPFYKWAYKQMKELPVLGIEVGSILYKLANIEGFNKDSINNQYSCISEICNLFIKEMRKQKLAFSNDWFLTFHGEEIRNSIEDEFLRSLPAQIEI